MNTSSRNFLQTLLPKLYRNMHDGSNQNRRKECSDGQRPAKQPADHQYRNFHDRPDAADRPARPLRQNQGQAVPRSRPQPGSDIHPRTETGQPDSRYQANPSDPKGRKRGNPIQKEQCIDKKADQDHVEHRSDFRTPALHPRRDGDQQKTDQLDPHPDGKGCCPGQTDVEHIPGRHAQIGLNRKNHSERHDPQTRQKENPTPQTLLRQPSLEPVHPHLSPLPLLFILICIEKSRIKRGHVIRQQTKPAILPRNDECGMHEKNRFAGSPNVCPPRSCRHGSV